jgi:phosphoglycolate phosphatase-like HAD superfamily hydrolase
MAFLRSKLRSNIRKFDCPLPSCDIFAMMWRNQSGYTAFIDTNYRMSNPASISGNVHQKPKLLLFDFDGTLADTRTIAHGILNDMSLEFGFRKLPLDQLEEARRMSTRDFIRHLGISRWRVPSIARRGLQLLHERIHLVEPISGMPETLTFLQERGVRMAILTSNSQANVEAFLIRHNLLYFEFVRSSSKLFGKGREIKRILRKEKLSPGEILYIGDETRDIEAAKVTGLPMAAVTWGYNSVEALHALNPEHLIHSPSDLLNLHLQLTRP